MKRKKNLDWMVITPTILIVVGIITFLTFRPEAARVVIQHVYDGVIGRFGWMYMLACIASFVLLIWITFSGYGDIKLGGKDAKPAFKEHEWAAMIFCSGVGSSAVILGFMEPLYYLKTPPMGIEAYSTQAYEYAHMLGQFHWGPSAWAFYIPAIAAVSIIVYKKDEPALRLSVVTKHLGKGKGSKIFGKVLDVFVQIGILCGISTSFGLAVPVLSRIISQCLHIPNNLLLKVGIMFLWIAIFTTAVYHGLEKGIKILSDINIILLVVFAGLVIIIAGPSDICKMEINSLGLYFQNFIRLNTWLDPFGSGDFQKLWTIFYWGWWLTFAPFMALFIVRVSKGRTLKRVLWMQLVWGSLGCMSCFTIFGGYSLKLQQSGAMNIVRSLEQNGQDVTIANFMQSMPLRGLMIFLFCALLFIFLATTIDSAAYVLASGCVKHLGIDEQPSKGNRVFWALMLAGLSIGLIIINQLKAVQTMSLIAGLPLIVVELYMCWAAVRLLKDHKHKKGLFKDEAGKAQEESTEKEAE